MSPAKTIPVVNSKAARDDGIGDLQYLHLPFNNKKEKRGIRSNVDNGCLQDSQYDLPEKNCSPRFNLSITTLKNDPIINPNPNEIVVKTRRSKLSIYYQYRGKTT